VGIPKKRGTSVHANRRRHDKIVIRVHFLTGYDRGGGPDLIPRSREDVLEKLIPSISTFWNSVRQKVGASPYSLNSYLGGSIRRMHSFRRRSRWESRPAPTFMRGGV